MDKQVYVLSHDAARRNAAQACSTAPEGWRVEIKPRTRTLAQNDMMWSILTDISRQVDFVVNGALVKVEPEEVKDILTASLRRETRMAMGIDGGMVLLGQRTSKMTVRQMADVIDLAYAFGNEKGVHWSPTSLGRGA
ncbi:recombination protein NinB [Bordetella avium]|nr:recombination protein NinB [Bordetella avium]UOK17056.1 recombination protein [Bordetella phage vB_BaM-IFTN1]UOK17183.1 recombination protein [Bordetella phage vB_BaM-IFTN3]UOK17249.1 recombination protein [Bordetella phage vB_BaM-IFTN4]UOK17323.1 recombination protein [Bordetella phage vB_BaM-IFTN5]UOK17455.1 recombination protein [Bordetella phage vB_BaM-IFTN7]UOK17528.1 recombination protein [Bordetella phage vB_BaM-IFTN8]UOK17595.1 recombination protein [Bordetella phage vB_BaM-IFTN9]